jgi:tripartite-type tricarboxylate transporter receptor subunit TctC
MVCLPAISLVAQHTVAVIRMLAVSTAERSPLMPDIPTLKEAGIEVEADAWSGLIAPAGIPDAMVARIGRLVGETMNSPVIRDKLAAQLMTPIPGTPAEFRARIDGDITRWSPVIAAAKIKIE